MKQLKASNGKDNSIRIETRASGRIDVNKHGFVKVRDHGMHMDTIRYEYIKKYYVVPEEMKP